MNDNTEKISYAGDPAMRIVRIEDALRRYMPKEAGLANPVREAMEYALMAGGKRIRPQLLLLSYEAFRTKKELTLVGPDKVDGVVGQSVGSAENHTENQTEDRTGNQTENRTENLSENRTDNQTDNQTENRTSIPSDIPEIFASALEMIHTYSLVHDDLPAMDDDSLRRGRPTVHVVYGEDVAILAGDGLLNYAYELAASAMERIPGDRRVERAMMILARRPGLFGMLGGQAADVTLAGKKLEDEQLNFIYANKTAALLECAMQIGAVLGGANEEETEQIRRAAYAAGIAFQVQDDILDMIGDAETLGKEVGQDERNEKTTYVTLYGMEAAEAYVRQLTDQANEILEGLLTVKKEGSDGADEMSNPAAEELISLLQSLVGRKK